MKYLSVYLIFILILSTIVTAQTKSNKKFSALGFYEFSYDPEDRKVVSNKFEFHRIYFTYQNSLSDELTYKFQIDAGRTDGGRLAVFIKNAKVDWKTKIGKVVVGLQGMNVFKINEVNWGYRFLEMSPMDLNKWASSADLGIGYYNTFADNINFSVLVTNGSGYKKAEFDKHKKISANLSYGQTKLTTKDGFNIGGVFTFEPFDFEKDSVTKTTETRMVYGVFGGYAGFRFRGGAEFDQRKTGGTHIIEQIISVYANYAVTNMVEVFGRFDLLDPNTDVDKDRRNLIIGGINITPTEGLSIAPNVRITSYQDSNIDSYTIYRLNFQFKIN